MTLSRKWKHRKCQCWLSSPRILHSSQVNQSFLTKRLSCYSLAVIVFFSPCDNRDEHTFKQQAITTEWNHLLWSVAGTKLYSEIQGTWLAGTKSRHLSVQYVSIGYNIKSRTSHKHTDTLKQSRAHKHTHTHKHICHVSSSLSSSL